jgi:hypothetical protein
MAVLTRITLLVLAAWAATATPALAHMGPSFPLAHGAGEESALMAQVVASYLAEQMGRDVVLAERATSAGALAAVKGREAPVAVVTQQEWALQGEGGGEGAGALVATGPAIPGPGGGFRLVAGREAAAQLSFSLLPAYADRLARATAGWDWARALTRVRDGEGRRRVALDLLRAADLI